MESVFVLYFMLPNNKTNKPQNYVFTSNVTAKNIEEAKTKFKIWHKNNNWNSVWIKLKDCINNNEIIF